MDLSRSTIEMDRDKAKEAFVAYKRGIRDRQDEELEQIARGYRELSRGKRLIRLSETIALGGTTWRKVVRFDRSTVNIHLPRLACIRADAKVCYTEGIAGDGSVQFAMQKYLPPNAHRMRVTLPAGTFLGHNSRFGSFKAMVPLVPPTLRPRWGLQNYHVLWEGEWQQDSPPPPRDPALLKHIGGDLYAVLATWDLTELERAVLAGRR